jgi:hypothetical protein
VVAGVDRLYHGWCPTASSGVFVGCWVLGMRLFGVSCALLASIRSGLGAGYGVAEGLQAQCVGEEEATFSESVVSKTGGLPSLRLGNPTNDVTAHVGRIGGGQWQRGSESRA